MIRTSLSFIARALQIVGLSTITYVIILFFGKTGMKPLLYLTITGIGEFYCGYIILILCRRR